MYNHEDKTGNKTTNINVKTAVYDTVNGNRSKTAKIIKSNIYNNNFVAIGRTVTDISRNIAFSMIFAVFDVSL